MEKLRYVRDSGYVISARSQELLTIDKEDRRLKFVESSIEVELSQSTTINCMEVNFLYFLSGKNAILLILYV